MCPSSAKPAASRQDRQVRGAWGRALRLAEEERQWRELARHLPESARLIWDILDHPRQFQRVLHLYGGQNLHVPRRLPDPRHPLRRSLGTSCLRKLMAAFGGTSLYVPRCEALFQKMRQHDIIDDFSRSTRQGVSSTAAVAGLARRHGISERRVWQTLKKDGSAPPQARLLHSLRAASRPPALSDNTP